MMRLAQDKPSDYFRNFGLILVLFIGILLRVIWPDDIEYKGDEFQMFKLTQTVGISEPWPWIGTPSGVVLRNPGMGGWIFILLAKLFSVQSPPELARTVQVTNIVALLLLLWFALRWVSDSAREGWLWTFVLACLNPYDVLLQRKIWIPSILPIFSMILLMAWTKRKSFGYSFVWGLVGACLGQIHMGGFFYAFAFFLGTAIFARKSTHWKGWLLGSLVGALGLLPWLSYIFEHPEALAGSGNYIQWYRDFALKTRPLTGWLDSLPLQFLWVWITNSFGLSLDASLYHDIWAFLDFPRFGEQESHLVLFLHVGLLLLLIIGIGTTLKTVVSRKVKNWIPFSAIDKDPEKLAVNIAFIGFGIAMSVAPFFIHHHYIMVAFPFLAFWLARLFQNTGRWRQRLLFVTCVFQFLLIVAFMSFIHINQGSTGDYGATYGAQRSR